MLATIKLFLEKVLLVVMIFAICHKYLWESKENYMDRMLFSDTFGKLIATDLISLSQQIHRSDDKRVKELNHVIDWINNELSSIKEMQNKTNEIIAASITSPPDTASSSSSDGLCLKFFKNLDYGRLIKKYILTVWWKWHTQSGHISIFLNFI